MQAKRDNGTTVAKLASQPGKVIVVGSQPVLDWTGQGSERTVALYGHVGSIYEIQYTTNLGPAALWMPVFSLQLSNAMQLLSIPPLAQTMFFRAREASDASLRIQQQNGQVLIEWLAGCESCQLQEAATVGPAVNWNPVLTQPQLINGTNRVTLSITPGTHLFRLGLQP
jgi:hypothetical protein